MNIGFVSTRFAGTDGVTLEAGKWAHVLEESGHQTFWFAGELSDGIRGGCKEPEAHFQDSQNRWINTLVFGREKQSKRGLAVINTQKQQLKAGLADFVNRFDIDLLIVQNALSIPMHIPLGAALRDFLEETRIPAIAHHHDFSWERSRFLKNGIKALIHETFPPLLPNIFHVVINSKAKLELLKRKSIISSVIPNVLDFENSPVLNGARCKAFREALGIGLGDILFLQPTRIVERKGIEQALALVKAVAPNRGKLVITHHAGDEGLEYLHALEGLARRLHVKLILADKIIADPSAGKIAAGSFSLWEAYQAADMVTYPSTNEGFGNALLEAIYFKKPLVVNRYDTYVTDIAPKGFRLIEMDGNVSEALIGKVRRVLDKAYDYRHLADYNYNIARKHYSYAVLRQRLPLIVSRMSNIFSGASSRAASIMPAAKPMQTAAYCKLEPEPVESIPGVC